MFHAVATRAANGAARCVQGGETYLMSSFGAYKGPPEGAEKLLGEDPVAYSDDIKRLVVSDVGMFRPETLFSDGGARLDAEALKLLCSGACLLPVANPPEGYERGYWLLKGVQGVSGGWDLLKVYSSENVVGIKMFPIYLQPELIEALKGHEGEVELSMVKTRINPAVAMFVYTSGAGVLYLLGCAMGNKSCISQINAPGDVTLVPDGWLSSSEWKRLVVKRGKKKMKGLVNPVRQNQAATVNAAPTAPEPKVEEPEHVAEAVVPAVEEPASEPVQTLAPAPVQLAESVPAEVVSEPVDNEDSQSAPKRRRAVRVSKPVGLDIAKMTEDISAPVEDLGLDQCAAAIEEIRALRDLQIAAARRAANLAIAYGKATTGIVEKWNALQAVLGK